MSGILGVFAPDAGGADDRAARSMLAGMAGRGTESEVRRDGTAAAALGVTRQRWELDEEFSGPVLVQAESALLVASDATLYYRRDLVRQLDQAGVRIRGTSTADLILAAYRAWGDRCAERLEGDFAFILWDGDERKVICSRDFGGKRPLFYAQFAGTIAIASSISALLAHPHCPSDLHPVAIASDATGFFAAAHETAYRAIRSLPAGSTLVHQNSRSRVMPHWTPPVVRESAGPAFDQAAGELRHLLQEAVRERLAPAGPTSVWLSGGWDSTAVFGAGNQALKEQGTKQRLHAVSISYPPGDVGREDELILAAAGHWGSQVQWLDIGQIPLLDLSLESAISRDEPFAHAFEACNRALAVGSRAAGARIALDGIGGDQLFQVSNIYLSDLFRTGRWLTLATEWRLKGMNGRGFRQFFRNAIQPLLPVPARRAIGVLRGGRSLRGHLERPLPPWIDRDFVRRTGLVEREQFHTPRRTHPDRAAYETEWYLSHPFFSRAFASVQGFALDSGVEVRSPLYDGRIIRFAASRPRCERSHGTETKRLLRRAMQGLLPDQVLAPRPYRTGSAEGYFARSMRSSFAPFLGGLIDDSMCLAQMGIVNPATLRRSWDGYVQRGGGELGVSLFLTLQTEIWLRLHAPGVASVSSRGAERNIIGAAVAAASPPGRAARSSHKVQEGSWIAKASST